LDDAGGRLAQASARVVGPETSIVRVSEIQAPRCSHAGGLDVDGARSLAATSASSQTRHQQLLRVRRDPDVGQERLQAYLLRRYLKLHPYIWRLMTKAFPKRLWFSSERFPEFLRVVSSLISEGLGHYQPYVNPQITLV
jgi:hypothetical protein